MSWRNRPTFIESCPEDIDYILFVDENGDSNLKYIKKCIINKHLPDNNNRFLTITGTIVKKEDLTNIKNKILALKQKYWENGMFYYKGHLKRVCFHSVDIRTKKGPFSDKIIRYNDFIIDLSAILDEIPAIIVSSTIDKYNLYMKYNSPYNPYNLSLNFVLERFVKYILKPGEKGIVILEARGEKDDKKLLDHIKFIIDNGTNVVSSNYFSKIKGVFFNPKWHAQSNGKKSYFGLEITDLYSYPIFKYCSTGTKDKAFQTLESKLFKYPNYTGCGVKKFP
ncbi:Protein of unknown function [Caloramator quimbayensis]|uniref:DUF3800 domain-containing protein n=1 Tax=Caloramator quimbayensis TaxID=1147123 RepID=A0A1T4YE44_9CLOT|nr:DUF3800 domain-containing protein [Caloramator quimbayensis]SKB00056.1 Protein of unknown function [Caloramator quimbayensis]